MYHSDYYYTMTADPDEWSSSSPDDMVVEDPSPLYCDERLDTFSDYSLPLRMSYTDRPYIIAILYANTSYVTTTLLAYELMGRCIAFDRHAYATRDRDNVILRLLIVLCLISEKFRGGDDRTIICKRESLGWNSPDDYAQWERGVLDYLQWRIPITTQLIGFYEQHYPYIHPRHFIAGLTDPYQYTLHYFRTVYRRSCDKQRIYTLRHMGMQLKRLHRSRKLSFLLDVTDNGDGGD